MLIIYLHAGYSKCVKACSICLLQQAEACGTYIHALILLAAMLAITSTQIDWYDVMQHKQLYMTKFTNKFLLFFC